VGTVVSSHVIPRPHDDIDAMIPAGPEEEKPAEEKKKTQRKPVTKKVRKG
jgi:microcompartment protein CcmL/EutN